jgi:phosphonate transport system substrate-binding protein
METLRLGAVAYDPKVVTIWEGFKAYFEARDLHFDFLLYSNYERQVEGLFRDEVHVAWNSPLAWIEAEQLARSRQRRARAVAMRDTDRDLSSIVLVRANSAVHALTDLGAKRVAVGAADSPQATLLPLLHFSSQGLRPGADFEVLYHDVLVGKHGDHIGGERDAVRALLAGEADAACILDANHLAFTRDGTLPAGATRVLAQTPPYDHCNFTVLDTAPAGPLQRFVDLLLGMSYEDARVRPLLDLEGLHKWLPGRTTGYAQLAQAVAIFGTLGPWLARMAGT